MDTYQFEYSEYFYQSKAIKKSHLNFQHEWKKIFYK